MLTHRPDLVMTISVPCLLNSVQRSLCSKVTSNEKYQKINKTYQAQVFVIQNQLQLTQIRPYSPTSTKITCKENKICVLCYQYFGSVCRGHLQKHTLGSSCTFSSSGGGGRNPGPPKGNPEVAKNISDHSNLLGFPSNYVHMTFLTIIFMANAF